ncbi:MAG: SPOR domain-containing protein [Desulfobacterales bacterium]|nr:SPOR domain-containing protein [Desulfobacterales bacterium]
MISAQLKSRCRLLRWLPPWRRCASCTAVRRAPDPALPAPAPPAAAHPGRRPPETAPGQPRPYKALGQWYQPIPDAKGFRQQGLASWYGPDFHGKRASSGEIYDMHAHDRRPPNAAARHPGAGAPPAEPAQRSRCASTTAGPSCASASASSTCPTRPRGGWGSSGPAPPRWRSWRSARSPGSPTDLYSGNFTFQVGAFASRDNAERLRAELNPRFGNAHIVEFDRGDRVFYRVRVGQMHVARRRRLAAH